MTKAVSYAPGFAELRKARTKSASREAFEEWLIEHRVQPNVTRKRSGDYMDMDTDWLWRAYCAGKLRGERFQSDASEKQP